MLLCRRSLLLHRGMGEVSRPCPALLFASLLLSYHVFLALTSLLFFGKNYFCRKAEPLSHASRSPFRGAFFDVAPPKPQSHLSVSHILIAINLGLPLCDVFIVLRQPRMRENKRQALERACRLLYNISSHQ